MISCVHTSVLNEEQKKEIQALAAACALEEPVTLSAPLEDGLEYFLGYEDGKLISMVFLFFPEDSVCECGAYTLPEKRRLGYFSELLDEALAFVETYEAKLGVVVDFCFLTDGNSPAAAAVLDTIGAEYWYSEYSMSLDLPVPAGSGDLLGKFSDSNDLYIVEAETNLYTLVLNDRTLGACMILPNGDSVYFYGFEIKRAYRGKGYGQSFLEVMIRLLSSDYRQITLQVSSLNTAAVALYKKTGFRITDTLSYYLY